MMDIVKPGYKPDIADALPYWLRKTNKGLFRLQQAYAPSWAMIAEANWIYKLYIEQRSI